MSDNLRITNTADKERALAFKNIKMAVRDSDIWKAAWYMGRFLKRSYTLTHDKLRWLKEEHIDRVKKLEAAVTELQKMALGHAEEDFQNWIEKGAPFSMVEQASYNKHFNNSNIAHLEKTITTYCRAAAYMKAIIEMKSTLAGLSMVEKTNGGIELEAMGACPGVEAYQNMEIEDIDWEFIEKKM
ncbi:hypothetical protein PtB15_17B185 [Puccinia triticina]|nr:hypothetical protein PtB15_17B185 [Puccinia triticina]